MSRLNDPKTTIVGAGIVGICTALALAKEGVDVRLIDRDEPGQGASYGNAGVISPWSVVPQSIPGAWRNIPGWLLKEDGPLFIRPSYFTRLFPWTWAFLKQGKMRRVREISDAMETLNQNNIELYRKLLAGTGFEALITDSYYVHAFRNPDKADIDALEYVLKREKGATIERIDGTELRQLEPALSPDFKTAIVTKGQARSLEPGKIGQVLFQQFTALGGEFLRADVTQIKPDANDLWMIETSEGAYKASKIVLAAGAWSGRLLAPLGVKVPLEAERGYHVEFPDAGVTLNNSVMDMELKCVASSMNTGLRIAGTAEFAGLDALPNQKRIDMLMSCAKRIVPDVDFEGVKSWSGVRPSSPDSLPFLGEVPSHKGLFAAFGHSHFGLMMAPKTGEVVTDMLLNRSVNSDYSPFQVNRFNT